MRVYNDLDPDATAFRVGWDALNRFVSYFKIPNRCVSRACCSRACCLPAPSCLLLAAPLLACPPAACLLLALLTSPSARRLRDARELRRYYVERSGPASEPVTFTCLICCASTSEVIRYASVVCQGGGGTGQDAQASDERLLATAHREVRLDDQSGLARRCPVLLVRRGPAEVRSDARDLPLLLCCSCCCRRRLLRF